MEHDLTGVYICVFRVVDEVFCSHPTRDEALSGAVDRKAAHSLLAVLFFSATRSVGRHGRPQTGERRIPLSVLDAVEKKNKKNVAQKK